MHYAILCYNDEKTVESWSKEEEEAVLGNRKAVQRKLAGRDKLGPVVRLMPTTAAVTVRAGRDPVVIDGPFAETKEQLLGLYIVDCDSLEEAIEVANELKGKETIGSFEIRPLQYLRHGADLK